MTPSAGAFIGGLLGSVAGGIVGALGGMWLSAHDGYGKKEREELIGASFVGGISLGATLGSVVGAGSGTCPRSTGVV
jgi:hypothetical protein